jgi:hypothetical protein
MATTSSNLLTRLEQRSAVPGRGFGALDVADSLIASPPWRYRGGAGD